MAMLVKYGLDALLATLVNFVALHGVYGNSKFGCRMEQEGG